MTDELDLAALEALEALEKEAMAAPWIDDGPPHNVIIWRDSHIAEDRVAFMTSDGYGAENAALIVALRNAAPALIKAARERDELRAERDIAIADARQIANTNMHAAAAYAGMRDGAEMLRGELDSLRSLLVRAGEAMANSRAINVEAITYLLKFGAGRESILVADRIHKSDDKLRVALAAIRATQTGETT